MKVIIIAAGTGARLGKEVSKLPKSLLEVNGQTILSRQISILKKIGIEEVVVITGQYAEKFPSIDVNYVNDAKHNEHDILGSLLVAKDYIQGNIVITYSDILFDENVLRQIIQQKCDIGIAVDMDWKQAYEERTLHPLTEAENVLLDDNKNVLKTQKNIRSNTDMVGEFLGIIKLSSHGAKILTDKFEYLLANHTGTFHNAISLKKAYITDLIQELVNSKIVVTPILISGKWCEIDTIQDLERAQKMFS
jgi:choline kinase|tara:strand:+ start:1231 stop:1977 length:747 start_codon:yes stop_codon:yes gene_type:complete